MEDIPGILQSPVSLPQGWRGKSLMMKDIPGILQSPVSLPEGMERQGLIDGRYTWITPVSSISASRDGEARID